MPLITGAYRPPALTEMQHARSTIIFSSDSGTVDVFTITGRVFVMALSAYCTADLIESGSVTDIVLGGATDPDAFIVSADPAAIDVNEWWADGSPVGGVKQIDALQIDVLTDEDVILTITGGTNITSGTLVFDFWYVPVTDNGLLVAA